MENVPFLKDELAIYRTILANERTFLAYIRTALSFFAIGVTFIKFFVHMIYQIAGWSFIPIGIVILFVGIFKYKKMRRNIREEEQEIRQDRLKEEKASAKNAGKDNGAA